jgi:hypothetical protein
MKIEYVAGDAKHRHRRDRPLRDGSYVVELAGFYRVTWPDGWTALLPHAGPGQPLDFAGDVDARSMLIAHAEATRAAVERLRAMHDR